MDQNEHKPNRTLDNPLNTLILETPKSGIFIRMIFGDFGDFIWIFLKAPADGQFLSGLGIRPLKNVWTHVRSASVADFIDCEPRRSNSVRCYASLVLLILVSKYIIDPLHPSRYQPQTSFFR